MNSRTTTWISTTRRGHGGLILLVVIAMAIILFLMFGSFGGSSYTQQLSETRKQGSAVVQNLNTRQLSMLIAMYRDQHGQLPRSPADLDNEAAFRDPWGGEITFTFEESPSGQTTIIYRSNGPDGKPGTEHDIVQRDAMPY